MAKDRMAALDAYCRAANHLAVGQIYLRGNPLPAEPRPAVLANSWLEGSYPQTYPDITRDASGMERLFRQFSFPGGVPSMPHPKLRARSTSTAPTCPRSPSGPGRADHRDNIREDPSEGSEGQEARASKGTSHELGGARNMSLERHEP